MQTIKNKRQFIKRYLPKLHLKLELIDEINKREIAGTRKLVLLEHIENNDLSNDEIMNLIKSYPIKKLVY
jgi:hypothetical protein